MLNRGGHNERRASMANIPKFLRLGLAALACAAALAACAPPESELGDEPPGSTLIVFRTSGAGAVSVSIDGVFQGTLTLQAGTLPSCDTSSLVEEVTASHVIKFVKPGAHTVSLSPGGTSSVTTVAGACTYKSA